jgi:Domain of unknown function (DUF4166)
MSRADVVQDGCFSDGRLPGRQRPTPEERRCSPHSLKEVLGHAAWTRLPEAVRVRFADPAPVDYVGEFEIVRASPLGRIIAWACQVIGTPVVPRTGNNVPAIVHVGPSGRGTEWRREYRWPGHSPCLVRSTKVIGADGALVEELPARLCMSLDVYEEAGALHFISRAYYFDVTIPWTQRRLRLVLPIWLSPGITHVEHIDGAQGWFRFTMTVTHPLFGEVFYQTGRFHASGD